jgi:hypothetical protein
MLVLWSGNLGYTRPAAVAIAHGSEATAKCYLIAYCDGIPTTHAAKTEIADA